MDNTRTSANVNNTCREFKDVVFEDVVFDNNNSFVTIYCGKLYDYVWQNLLLLLLLLLSTTSSNTTSLNSETCRRCRRPRCRDRARSRRPLRPASSLARARHQAHRWEKGPATPIPEML